MWVSIKRAFHIITCDINDNTLIVLVMKSCFNNSNIFILIVICYYNIFIIPSY